MNGGIHFLRDTRTSEEKLPARPALKPLPPPQHAEVTADLGKESLVSSAEHQAASQVGERERATLSSRQSSELREREGKRKGRKREAKREGRRRKRKKTTKSFLVKNT